MAKSLHFNIRYGQKRKVNSRRGQITEFEKVENVYVSTCFNCLWKSHVGIKTKPNSDFQISIENEQRTWDVACETFLSNPQLGSGVASCLFLSHQTPFFDTTEGPQLHYSLVGCIIEFWIKKQTLRTGGCLFPRALFHLSKGSVSVSSGHWFYSPDSEYIEIAALTMNSDLKELASPPGTASNMVLV